MGGGKNEQDSKYGMPFKLFFGWLCFVVVVACLVVVVVFGGRGDKKEQDSMVGHLNCFLVGWFFWLKLASTIQSMLGTLKS